MCDKKDFEGLKVQSEEPAEKCLAWFSNLPSKGNISHRHSGLS